MWREEKQLPGIFSPRIKLFRRDVDALSQPHTTARHRRITAGLINLKIASTLQNLHHLPSLVVRLPRTHTTKRPITAWTFIRADLPVKRFPRPMMCTVGCIKYDGKLTPALTRGEFASFVAYCVLLIHHWSAGRGAFFVNAGTRAFFLFFLPPIIYSLSSSLDLSLQNIDGNLAARHNALLSLLCMVKWLNLCEIADGHEDAARYTPFKPLSLKAFQRNRRSHLHWFDHILEDILLILFD
jgi:hypothetical protein